MMSRIGMTLSLTGLLGTVPVYAQQNYTDDAKLHPTFPKQIVPNGLGVNIHFTNPRPGEMKMMDEAGYTWVRMDFGWGGTEKQKGVYDFSAFETLMKALDEKKMKPIFILDYGNMLYSPENPNGPHTESANTPEYQAAFAKWAAAAVTHFKGRGIVWEIWNEPNGGGFWKPKPDANIYAALALAASKAIRAAAPKEAIVGPATSGLPFDYLETCFKAGLLNYWDGVSVHPYRQTAPETASEDYRKLRMLIQQYAPKGKYIPILSGEWGFSASAKWGPYNETSQGQILPREWMTNLYNNVPISIWYDWHDDGTDPNEPEHHFGTVANKYNEGRDPIYDPKPAYLAAKTFTSTLRGFRFNKRLWTGQSDEYVYLFNSATNPNDVRLAVWTTAVTPRTITVPASDGIFRAILHTGNEAASLTAANGKLTVEANDSPLYLIPTKPNDVLRVAAAWERAPLELTVPGGQRISNVRLNLRNPLNTPLQVNAKSLASGGTLAVAGEDNAVFERSSEPQNVTLALTVGMGANTQVIRQLVPMVITNPLTLTVLPGGNNTLAVQVDNPSGEAFKGSLKLSQGPSAVNTTNDATVPVTLAKGETSKIVRLPWQGSMANLSQSPLHLALSEGKNVVLDWPSKAGYTRLVPVTDFSQYPQPADLAAAYAILPDGDMKVASTQTIGVATPPSGLPPSGTAALKLDYRWDEGWKFLRLAPKTPALQAIEGQPKALQMWVYGNGDGHTGRLRITDATGQTFQPNGGPINWTGWKLMTFPLNGNNAGHWGGANDGTIHYPLHWDSIFLFDSAGKAKSEGTVYISAPTLVYDVPSTTK